MNSEPPTSLLRELVDSASRDLVTFTNAEDPNKRAAGEAALRGLNAVIRAANIAREKLLGELYGPEGQPKDHLRHVAGNSGPGGRIWS